MTFLALDVGNTRLKWAQYESAEPGAAMIDQGAVFLENIDNLAEGDWSQLTPPAHILGCIVAGDAIKRRVAEQLELWDTLPSWVVPSPFEAGLTNGYDYPARLGADRWVAMIGARHRMLRRGIELPCVVVMVGTAVTVEALDASGKFLGGIILPGHGIMLRALESGTAGLHVPTGEVRDFPTNTSDALTSGGTFAIAGAVQRMVDNTARQCGQAPLCLMTGGAGWKVAPSMSVDVELVESLIFDGLLEVAAHRLANGSGLCHPIFESGFMVSNLQAAFEEAIDLSKNLSERPDNATLLKLYALYKQGREGDNPEPKPGFSDPVARAKWDAWSKLKDTSQDDAMRSYIDLVASLA